MRPTPSTPRRSLPVFLASLLAFASCSGGGGDEDTAFQVTTTQYAVASDTPVAILGRWVAFLADEASSGGQDLNSDGEVVDQVAIAVNVDTKVQTNLGVAAIALAWLGEELYVVVDEVFDGRDWGGSSNPTELVLLRWHSTLTVPVLVGTLNRNSSPAIVVVANTLFFAADGAPAGSEESTLFAIEATSQGVAQPVFTQDSVGGLSPRLIGQDEGMVFVALDEATEGRILNGDADTTDIVLALLDGGGEALSNGYDRILRNTGLAISGTGSPYRASYTGSDWLVGFLVDEAGQGLNLNLFDGNTLPASWQVAGCFDDNDTSDRVLHVIEFGAWDTNPAVDPPINTGIVGTDRVLIVGDAVATISLEADEGTCSLNGDSDQTDRVLRWFRNDANGPVTSTAQLLALDTGVAGPALAVAELDGVFVVQCDESADDRNHDDASGTDRDLLAWLDPAATSPSWTFDHGQGLNSAWATATWMGEQPQRTRLGVAYSETSNAADLNGDGDQLDSVPTFADLPTGTSRRLIFPGFARAVVPDQAGITVANGWGFYRVDEAADDLDLNGNGDADDILLVRSDLASGNSWLVGALNSLPRPAVEVESDGIGPSAAYLFDETIIGINLSGDTDALDLVVRYFTFL